MAVASITINIFDEQLHKLQALAQESDISLEDLLSARIENWLSQPTSEFAQAANYVLKKNAELYRRLTRSSSHNETRFKLGNNAIVSDTLSKRKNER
ncbi:hypothetical protein LC607_24595 [Nostoc sp. CHAB 5824]|nr:hypothetical protein [Nostoc sp. CHAB 5824]